MPYDTEMKKVKTCIQNIISTGDQLKGLLEISDVYENV